MSICVIYKRCYIFLKPQHAVQRQTICIVDTDHDYILDGIMHCNNIDCEERIHNEDILEL